MNSTQSKGVGYAERRDQWLENAEHSLHAMRLNISTERYGFAAAAARDAAHALEKAAGEHEFYLRVQP